MEKPLRHCWVVESKQPYGWDAEITLWKRSHAREEAKKGARILKVKTRVRKYVPCPVGK
jgi:hypothetical protein